MIFNHEWTRHNKQETGNYVVTGTQTIGPIVTDTGMISDSVSPWAKFPF